MTDQTKSKFISRTEEYVLLSVWRLKENAYAVTVRSDLSRTTGKTWAFGALFIILNRLEKKGFLESRLSDPTPKRGGKSKRYYTLSAQGAEILDEVKRVHNAVWSGTEDLPSPQ
jgi:PadR family transcriptional regulator PadR